MILNQLLPRNCFSETNSLGKRNECWNHLCISENTKPSTFYNWLQGMLLKHRFGQTLDQVCNLSPLALSPITTLEGFLGNVCFRESYFISVNYLEVPLIKQILPDISLNLSSKRKCVKLSSKVREKQCLFLFSIIKKAWELSVLHSFPPLLFWGRVSQLWHLPPFCFTFLPKC